MSSYKDNRLYLEKNDPQIYELIQLEEKRQKIGMELIPSENYVLPSVLAANGSVLTNKYAEGYPGKRYYGGCTNVDKVELLAIERIKKLFPGSIHANVQPHSGCPANEIVYSALLNPGDTILGMNLAHGGHLSHGHPVTKMAKLYNFVRYQMKDIDTGEIDYEELREIALKEKPKIILAGFSAYSRDLDYAKFQSIADEVGAISMMDAAHIAGLIAGKQLKNPFDYGFDIVTSTTHKTLRGPRGGVILTSSEEIGGKIDKMTFPGLQGGPHMHTIASKAIAFGEALKPEFQEYAAQVIKNAKVMEKVFKEKNVRMIAGGTDNHLLLIDTVTSFGVTGQEAETILDEVNITLNKNVIANDQRTPLDPSGIRLGTPAMTTRGFKEEEFKITAELICEAIVNRKDNNKIKEISNKIETICKKFPVPGI
jgi:glycine hydroxymethyltransferase